MTQAGTRAVLSQTDSQQHDSGGGGAGREQSPSLTLSRHARAATLGVSCMTMSVLESDGKIDKEHGPWWVGL